MNGARIYFVCPGITIPAWHVDEPRQAAASTEWDVLSTRTSRIEIVPRCGAAAATGSSLGLAFISRSVPLPNQYWP